ncbi:MAG: nucleotidyltransferase domain-containing protein [Candidatus Aenigmatarchaeota archaeon]
MALEKLEEELKKAEKLVEEENPKKKIYPKVIAFTNEARKQYGELIKSVLVFGSAAKGTMKEGSDIDIWVILDDTATKSSEDLQKINTQLYLIAQELKDLHIQTTTLTEFWNWIRLGSPELINFLRYSLPIYDAGFIKPIKRMLEMGLIPPSEETVKLKAEASEARLKKLEIDLKSMIFELRYAATDACQAVVMYYYKSQPDQKALPEFLEKLVKEKKLEPEFVEKFKALDKLWKDVDHKAVEKVDAAYLEKALNLTREIIERMKKLLPKEFFEGE